MEAKASALRKRAVVVRIGGHAGTVNILQDKFYPVKKRRIWWEFLGKLHKNAALFLRRISRFPLRGKAKRSRRSELAVKQTGGVSYPKKHTPSDLAFASATSL